jgi:flagellar biosynthesis/type III secretory pathway M-ring protein FliF/YscJ
VPHGKQAVYMGALANAGALPNNFGDSLRKMLDKSSSPWIGKHQQEEMSKIALQDELTKIINSMPGIESASVLYNVQIEQGLNTKKLVTASVNVKPAGNQLLGMRQVEMIRQVVGPPIGIDPQCVAIVDFNGATYPAATAGGIDSGSERYAKTKIEYEQKYTEKIRDALSFVPGAVVTVNVELHPELEETDNSARVDPRSAATGGAKSATSGTAVSAESSHSDTAGGLNQPAIIKSFVESVVGSAPAKKESINRQGRNLVIDSRQITKAGLTPKRVTVSVGIPSSYYSDVWRQRQLGASNLKSPKPDTETLRQVEAEVCANIKQHILQVVPWPEDANQDHAQLVTVTTFQHAAITETEHLAAADHHPQDWIAEHATTLGVSVLAVVSLLAVRWIVGSVGKAKTDSFPLRVVDGNLDALDENNFSGRDGESRFHNSHGPALREELAGIVHNDPDVAASVLRNWIGSAS